MQGLSDTLLARLAAHDENTDVIQPPIYLWHQTPFDPANPGHVNDARVAGGIVVDLAQPDTWEAAAMLAENTGVPLALAVHPCKKGMGWNTREARDPRIWGDRWAREINRLNGLLIEFFKRFGESVRQVFVDSEVWNRDARQAPHRATWNTAIALHHDQLIALIQSRGHGVQIEFYGMNPRNHCCSLRENTRVASVPLYKGTYADNCVRLVETVTWAQAGPQWDSVTAWVAMGMQHHKGKWDDGTRRDEQHAWKLGKLIGQSQIGRRVHAVIHYLWGWDDPRNADQARHFGAFLLGMRGLPVEEESNVIHGPYDDGGRGDSNPK
jgi:hypothetical protein